MRTRTRRILVIVAVVGILAAAGIGWLGFRLLRPYLLDPAAEAGPAVPRTMAPGVENLAEILEPIRREYRRPALAAAVVRDGEISAIGAVGVRQAGGTERVTLADRFHLGSCTKAMTATLIAQLVEVGTLRWQTTVGEVFPDLEDIHPRFRSVTVEQLLSHRSGLPDDRKPDRDIFPQLRRLRGLMPEQRRHLTQLVLAREPTVEPGTEKLYSNYGYTIAGAMAEQVTGEPWETLLRVQLFAPLGMTTAGFGPPGSASSVDQPRGHRGLLGALLPMTPGPAADNPRVIGPSGAVHSSIGDFARWAAFHLRGARGEGQLLKPETFVKLHSDIADQGYALGWGVAEREWAGGKTLRHAGSNTMFMAVIRIAPEQNLALVVATNSGDGRAFKACDAVVRALLEEQGLL